MNPYFLVFVQIILFIVGLYVIAMSIVWGLYAQFVGGIKRRWALLIFVAGLALTILPFAIPAAQ